MNIDRNRFLSDRFFKELNEAVNSDKYDNAINSERKIVMYYFLLTRLLLFSAFSGARSAFNYQVAGGFRGINPNLIPGSQNQSVPVYESDRSQTIKEHPSRSNLIPVSQNQSIPVYESDRSQTIKEHPSRSNLIPVSQNQSGPLYESDRSQTIKEDSSKRLTSKTVDVIDTFKELISSRHRGKKRYF